MRVSRARPSSIVFYRIVRSRLDMLNVRERRARQDLGPAQGGTPLPDPLRVTGIEPIPDGRVAPPRRPQSRGVARDDRLAFVAACKSPPCNGRPDPREVLRGSSRWRSSGHDGPQSTARSSGPAALARASHRLDPSSRWTGAERAEALRTVRSLRPRPLTASCTRMRLDIPLTTCGGDPRDTSRGDSDRARWQGSRLLHVSNVGRVLSSTSETRTADRPWVA